MNTYIVEANHTLYFIDATSIVAAASEALGIPVPNRRMTGITRWFSDAKGRRATEHCTVYLSLDEIRDCHFYDHAYKATPSCSAFYCQGVADAGKCPVCLASGRIE
jgi:hypothetical protein